MDSDFDDELDDLLADMANGDKKRTTEPQVKDASKATGSTAPWQSEKSHRGAEGGDILGNLDAKNNDSGSFMSSLLGGKTSLQQETKAQSTTKDPLSEIFEKGAWKQALRQPTTTGDSPADDSFETLEVKQGSSKQSGRRGVRFSDELQADRREAKPVSKLDEWLQEESADFGSSRASERGTRDDGANLTEEMLKINKDGSDNPAAPRRRGVVDLAFLDTNTDKTSGTKKDSSFTKPSGSRRGNGADWLELAEEGDVKDGMEFSVTLRPNTAPEASTVERRASGSEKSIRETRRRGGSDRQGLDSDSTAWKSLEDVNFGGDHKIEGEPEKKLPEKILPWLPRKSEQKAKDTSIESMVENRHAEMPNTETKSGTRTVQGTDAHEKISSASATNNATEARLKVEITNLSNQLHLVEQERDLLRRHAEKLSEMHRTELQNCEDAHRKLQRTTEAQLTEQHEKSVKYYESTLRRLEAKVADADLERARLEGEMAKRTESLRQQCREEVASLQEAHSLALAKLRTEHEEEVSRLRRMKSQEVEAVCGTLDRARNLQCLTDQLGQQHVEMERLRRKLEETVDSDLATRREALDDKERRLRGFEATLRREREESMEELRQARRLIAYLQQLNDRQARQVEEEKWRLRQELAKLHAYKKVQEDRAGALEDHLQRQRALLENVKNNLLREQHSLVARVAESLREATRERLDARTSFAVGRVSEEVRAARFDSRRREIEAADAELERKRRDVERRSLSATELWEKCERQQRFLANWESQLQARESALLKEKVSLLQRRHDTETAIQSPQKVRKSTAIVNPTASLWRRKGEEDEAYLQEQSSFLESLKTKASHF